MPVGHPPTPTYPALLGLYLPQGSMISYGANPNGGGYGAQGALDLPLDLLPGSSTPEQIVKGRSMF